MKICPGLIAFAFLAMLGLAGPVLAAEDGLYPIWWSGELELESLDRVEARLEDPFWKNGKRLCRP